MADNLMKMQMELLENAAARKEFAADPRRFLKKAGVEVGDDSMIPEKIDPIALEMKLDIAKSRIGAKALSDIRDNERLLSDVFAPEITADSDAVRERLDKFKGTQATVAVMAAVVEVVVAP